MRRKRFDANVDYVTARSHFVRSRFTRRPTGYFAAISGRASIPSQFCSESRNTGFDARSITRSMIVVRWGTVVDFNPATGDRLATVNTRARVVSVWLRNAANKGFDPKPISMRNFFFALPRDLTRRETDMATATAKRHVSVLLRMQRKRIHARLLRFEDNPLNWPLEIST